jgi:hypothetical protein
MLLRIIDRIEPLLNRTRLRYPYFIGGALWLGWLISLALGSGNTDAAGHLIGTDFVAFYSAGKIVSSGQQASLYDLELARQIQQPLYGAPSDNFNPYLNPPFYALLFVPFSYIPYPWSPILWMLVSLGMGWLGLRLISKEHAGGRFYLTLTWLPAFSAISFGQNAFLSLLLMGLVFWFWRREKFFWAGLAAGLLLYKPQLVFGLGLLWLFEYRKNWPAVVGAACSGLGLGILSLVGMPEATWEYITYTQKIAANLMTVEGFPIWNAHAGQAFWLAIFPGETTLAQALHWVGALAGVIAFYRFWRVQRENPNLLFGAAICLTIWITPYLMIYDWVLLTIPAVLVWQSYPALQPRWRVIFAFLWIVMLFSSVLTFLQWNALGRAVQISVPALAIATAAALQLIRAEKPA